VRGLGHGAAAIAVVLGATACSEPDAIFTPAVAIPLTLAANNGGLLGLGTAAQRDQPFPMLVDTASPVTAFSDGSDTLQAMRGTVRLYGNDPDVGEVPRLELPDIQLFVTQLGGTGLDAASPISGVLGGDNLERFVASFSYTPTPRLELADRLIVDDCGISQHCGAVLPFSLGGGHQLIDIGENVYSYPASYVLLDACLEPMLDPLEPGLECKDIGCKAKCPMAVGVDQDNCVEACNKRLASCGGSCNDCDDDCAMLTSQQCADCVKQADRYLTHGIDIRLAIATGFPVLALTAAAYDRLRGEGRAAALIGASSHTLFSPDQAVGSAGVPVGLDQLGVVPTSQLDPAGRAALALVGRNSYFGACAELARSRRLRDKDPNTFKPATESCLRSPDRHGRDAQPPQLQDASIIVCADNNSSHVCDDRSDDAHVTPYAELQGTVPIIVVPDTTSLLQSINADVRPDSATVEGVIGTELLRRLGTTIDYPNGRVVVTCNDPSCRVFPQWGHGTQCLYPAPDEPFGGGTARVFGGGGCALP
jgi:hypothetical protein